MQTFQELLQRARGGDPLALKELFEPHLPRMTGFVRLRLGASPDREQSCADIVQSACGRAIDGLADLRGQTEDAFRRWLFAIAINRLRERLRDRGAGGRRRELATLETAVTDGDLLASYANLETPSREAVAHEEVARIERAFEQLPDDYREVLLLARMAELSYAEVAEQTGRSEGSVRQLLYRARARLAMLLA